jgi:hypothetical protein
MASHYQPPKITLKTDVDFDSGVISQELVEEGTGLDIVREKVRWVVNTREKAIRDALVSLGWTPPESVDGS